MVPLVKANDDCQKVVYHVANPAVPEETIYRFMNQMIGSRIQGAQLKKGSTYLETLRNFFQRPLSEALQENPILTQEQVEEKVKALTAEHLKSQNPTDFKPLFKDLKKLALAPHIGVCPKKMTLVFHQLYQPIINEHYLSLKKNKQTELAATLKQNYDIAEEAFLKYTQTDLNALNEFDCNCRHKLAAEEFSKRVYGPLQQFLKDKTEFKQGEIQPYVDRIQMLFDFIVELSPDDALNAIGNIYRNLIVGFLKRKESKEFFNMGVSLIKILITRGQRVASEEQLSSLLLNLVSLTLNTFMQDLIQLGRFVYKCTDCQFDFKNRKAETQALLIEKVMAYMNREDDLETGDADEARGDVFKHNEEASRLDGQQIKDTIENLDSALNLDWRVVYLIKISMVKIILFPTLLSENEEVDAPAYHAARKLLNRFIAKRLEPKNTRELTTMLDEEIEQIKNDEKLGKFYLVFKLWNYITEYNNVEKKPGQEDTTPVITWGGFSDEAVSLLNQYETLLFVYRAVTKQAKGNSIHLSLFAGHFTFDLKSFDASKSLEAFRTGHGASEYGVEFSGEAKSLHGTYVEDKTDVDENAGPQMSRNKAGKEDPLKPKRKGTFEEDDVQLDGTQGGAQPSDYATKVGVHLAKNALGKLGEEPQQTKDLAGKIGQGLEQRISDEEPEKVGDLAGKIAKNLGEKLVIEKEDTPTDIGRKIGQHITAKPQKDQEMPIETGVGEPNKVPGKLADKITEKIKADLGHPSGVEILEDDESEPRQNIQKHPGSRLPGDKEDDINEGRPVKKGEGEGVQPKTGTTQPQGGVGQLYIKTIVDCSTLLNVPSDHEEWWIEENNVRTETTQDGFNKEIERCKKGKFIIKKETLKDCDWTTTNIPVNKKPASLEQYFVVDKNGNEIPKEKEDFMKLASDCGYGDDAKNYDINAFIVSDDCKFFQKVMTMPGTPAPDEELETFYQRIDGEDTKITRQKYHQLKYKCNFTKFIPAMSLTLGANGKMTPGVTTHFDKLPEGVDQMAYIDQTTDTPQKVSKEQFAKLIATKGYAGKIITARITLLPGCRTLTKPKFADRKDPQELMELDFSVMIEDEEVVVSKEDFGFLLATCVKPLVTGEKISKIKGDCAFSMLNVGHVGSPSQEDTPNSFHDERNGGSKSISEEEYEEAVRDCGENAKIENGSAVDSFWNAHVLDDCRPYGYTFSEKLEDESFVVPDFYLLLKDGKWIPVTKTIFENEERKCVTSGRDKKGHVEVRELENTLLPQVEKRIPVDEETLPGKDKSSWAVKPKLVPDEHPGAIIQPDEPPKIQEAMINQMNKILKEQGKLNQGDQEEEGLRIGEHLDGPSEIDDQTTGGINKIGGRGKMIKKGEESHEIDEDLDQPLNTSEQLARGIGKLVKGRGKLNDHGDEEPLETDQMPGAQKNIVQGEPKPKKLKDLQGEPLETRENINELPQTKDQLPGPNKNIIREEPNPSKRNEFEHEPLETRQQIDEPPQNKDHLPGLNKNTAQGERDPKKRKEFENEPTEDRESIDSPTHVKAHLAGGIKNIIQGEPDQIREGEEPLTTDEQLGQQLDGPSQIKNDLAGGIKDAIHGQTKHIQGGEEPLKIDQQLDGPSQITRLAEGIKNVIQKEPKRAVDGEGEEPLLIDQHLAGPSLVKNDIAGAIKDAIHKQTKQIHDGEGEEPALIDQHLEGPSLFKTGLTGGIKDNISGQTKKIHDGEREEPLAIEQPFDGPAELKTHLVGKIKDTIHGQRNEIHETEEPLDVNQDQSALSKFKLGLTGKVRSMIEKDAKLNEGDQERLEEQDGSLEGDIKSPGLKTAVSHDKTPTHLIGQQFPPEIHEDESPSHRIAINGPVNHQEEAIRAQVIKMINNGFRTKDTSELESSPLIVSYLKKNPVVIDPEEDVETLVVVIPVARTNADCYKLIRN